MKIESDLTTTHKQTQRVATDFVNAIDELLNEGESSSSASREDKIRTMLAAALKLKETLIEIRAQNQKDWAEITDKFQKIESDFTTIHKK